MADEGVPLRNVLRDPGSQALRNPTGVRMRERTAKSVNPI